MKERLLLAIHTDCVSMNAEDDESNNQNDRNDNGGEIEE
jgi:hypothetical protein